jgi:hypothetical protein
MALDLWFREDVARILLSVHETMRASLGAVASARTDVADAYQQGFADALQTVGIAFGVAVPGALGHSRSSGNTCIVDHELSQLSVPAGGSQDQSIGSR